MLDSCRPVKGFLYCVSLGNISRFLDDFQIPLLEILVELLYYPLVNINKDEYI
jgi:hypothetical protein